MNTESKDGGPAFVGLICIVKGDDIDGLGNAIRDGLRGQAGLTVRDIYAAASLQGWRAGGDVSPTKDIARLALDDAEAVMGEARRRDEEVEKT